MPTNITDVDDFTDPITRPTDGADQRTAASLAGLYQGLSNRTRNLKNRLDGIGATVRSWSAQNTFSDLLLSTAAILLDGSADIYYSAGMTPAARARETFSPARWLPGDTTSPADSEFAVLTADRQTITININDYLPTGAVLTQVRALVRPGFGRVVRSGGPATSGDNGRMYLRADAWTTDWASPDPGTLIIVPLAEDAGTTDWHVITSPILSGTPINRAAPVALYVRLVAGVNAATYDDQFAGFYLDWTDPGPRNH